ncbi:MAG TPA: hypothetical protein PLB21_02735 [Actinomycetota bacterium]|jgi:hypothetical protein|nr:hypothetical protein [Actinomycetota bacterium]
MRARRMSAAVAVACLMVAGCGADRSPEKFCSVMDKHKDRYLTAMGQATDALGSDTPEGTLAGLSGGLVAIADLQIMWEELADVSPDEVKADVERIRDENAKQLEATKDSIDNPLGALGRSLAGGLMVSGSYQRVDAYTKQHCS